MDRLNAELAKEKDLPRMVQIDEKKKRPRIHFIGKK
jgi:hypothetical protein